MSTPRHVHAVIIPPKGWKLLRYNQRIEEGDYIAGVMDSWQVAGASIGYPVCQTGFRAAIRKINKRPASRNEY